MPTAATKKIMYIGRDYKGTLSNVAFDGVAGNNTATVTWYLYNSDGDEIGTGTGTYVSAGVYTFIIDKSYIADQAPEWPAKFTRGVLYVEITQGTADGSFGYEEVEFRWPNSLAA